MVSGNVIRRGSPPLGGPGGRGYYFVGLCEPVVAVYDGVDRREVGGGGDIFGR